MNPAQLIPAPDPIPVPAAWFQVLLPLTFLLHLLLMNVVLGGTIIAFVNRLKGNRHAPVGASLSKKLPTSLALAVNLGVPPLLFLQVVYGNFTYVSSILMAGWWLSLVAILIIGYYALYVHDSFRERSGGTATFALGLSSAMLLFTSFMLSNNMTLMLNTAEWLKWFDTPNGSLLNLSDPTLFPRWLHFVCGATAVAGLFIAIIGHIRNRSNPGSGSEHIELGLKWFTRATMAAMAFGVWWLISLERNIMLAFMGKDMFSTIVLLAGIGLGTAGLVYGLKKRPVGATVLTVAGMLFMVLARDAIRRIAVSPYHSLDAMPVHQDWSPLIFFLLATALAIPVIVWMIRLHINAVKEG